VLTGVVDLQFDRSWLYEKELSFQVSCSYGPGRYEEGYEGRGLDYPIAFVRWTEQRNISAVLSAMANGWLHADHISRASFNFLNAAAAYDLLSNQGDGRPPMAIGLTYGQEVNAETCVTVRSEEVTTEVNSHPSISVIGAGNYATRRMLPGLVNSGAKIKHIVSKGGLSSSIAALKFNSMFSTVDIEEVANSEGVGGVCIATRHDSHTELALRMIEAGKLVFVEKPLAINMDQLELLELLTDEQKRHIFVGFNREFSDYTRIIKNNFSSDKSPKIISLEMNAGTIPVNHWTQDISIGGGRLIGEAIHYISLAQFIANSRVINLHVESVRSSLQVPDTFSLTLNFENGDLANILYYANGSGKYKKEVIKCIGGGKVFEIDNFKRLRGFGSGIAINKKSMRQLKGQDECFADFARHVESGEKNSLERAQRYLEASKVSILATEILMKQGRGSAEIH
jgi:predicted dehydrogenase